MLIITSYYLAQVLSNVMRWKVVQCTWISSCGVWFCQWSGRVIGWGPWLAADWPLIDWGPALINQTRCWSWPGIWKLVIIQCLIYWLQYSVHYFEHLIRTFYEYTKQWWYWSVYIVRCHTVSGCRFVRFANLYTDFTTHKVTSYWGRDCLNADMTQTYNYKAILPCVEPMLWHSANCNPEFWELRELLKVKSVFVVSHYNTNGLWF